MSPTLRNRLLYSAVAIISLLAGIITARYLDSPSREAVPVSAERPAEVPKQRVDFTLKDLQGNERSLSNWDGNVILLNFWATWCPPCRKEMPDFVEMKEEMSGKPFEIVGVAIDQAQLVQDFIDSIGVEYPILIAELEGMQIMKAYGNQLLTLPYTVLIDREGNVVKAFRTEVNKEMLKPMVEKLL